MINSFFLFVEENGPTQTDNEVSIFFQESVLVCLDKVGEGWETVGNSGDSLHLQFVALQGCTAAHLRLTISNDLLLSLSTTSTIVCNV